MGSDSDAVVVISDSDDQNVNGILPQPIPSRVQQREIVTPDRLRISVNSAMRNTAGPSRIVKLQQSTSTHRTNEPNRSSVLQSAPLSQSASVPSTSTERVRIYTFSSDSDFEHLPSKRKKKSNQSSSSGAKKQVISRSTNTSIVEPKPSTSTERVRIYTFSSDSDFEQLPSTQQKKKSNQSSSSGVKKQVISRSTNTSIVESQSAPISQSIPVPQSAPNQQRKRPKPRQATLLDFFPIKYQSTTRPEQNSNRTSPQPSRVQRPASVQPVQQSISIDAVVVLSDSDDQNANGISPQPIPSRVQQREIVTPDRLSIAVNSAMRNTAGPSRIVKPQQSTSTHRTNEPNRSSVPQSAPLSQSAPLPTKRKRGGRFTKRQDRVGKRITVVKCKLQSILKNDRNGELITNLISDMCLRATKICQLASLIMLDFIHRSANDFSLFDGYASQHVKNAFFSATTSSSTVLRDIRSPGFLQIMANRNVDEVSSSVLNNAYNSLCHMYETNFKNNVKTHAQKRIVRLFKLWFIEANGVKPSSRHMKVLKNAATFMFKRKSTVPRNPYLTQRLMMYMPPQIVAMVANSNERGFMNKLHNAFNWFRMVPLYLRIQSDIDQYQATCRAADEPIHVRNFHVVPLHNSKTKYIRIDSATLKLMLQHLKIHPTKPSLKQPNKRVCLTNAEFEDAVDPTGTFNPNWFNYFKWSAVKKMQRHKEFDYQFLTNGVAVSLQFIVDQPPEPETFEKVMEKQKIKYRKFGQRFNNNQYKTIIGIDPGYKLYLAAVSKDMRTNEETLFRLTSRKFHNMCQQNIRDRKAKRYTSQLETEMAHDREVNFGGTIASPMSATNYMLFIDHRLKHFNSCIALYTQNKYTELAFHKYVHTQKAMDGIVNELLPSSRSHERSLLVIGGTEFNPSAPIKKYRRCPGVRQLVKFVRKRTGCDIVYADEYNTSQVCGRCQRRFKTSDDETIQHKRWERKGARMRLCSNCTPNDNIIPLPTTINTRMSPRAQHLHRLAITNRLFFNVAAYSMEDAKRESDNIHYIAENCCYDVSHDKHTFDPNDRTTQLKCVWNRDISAARNILIKGVASITGIPAPRTLYRQTQINEENSSDESMD